ncbi:MAG: undecaprenyl/decaprenyl-phosphate alpha-N-acetylglucosaminyl 1-phosphate transferase [Clostridiales bacterium]|nr:undecaprenyl/decaprenyl-phosphate alpha-N-acetylglucosaminyl 1-phosphate transferase [Clostridiales bacterium]
MTGKNYLIIALAIVLSCAISYASTPFVKKLAYKVGAIDVPKDERRMHKVPIPRLGGLAIFAGFLVSLLVFGTLDITMISVLIGATIIVVMGVLDDIYDIKAWVKLLCQLAAALIPVLFGKLRIETLFNLDIFSSDPYSYLGIFSIPVTVIWIMALTNAVNFIDGLDGLAAGVSAISALSLLIISCVLANPYVAVVMAALAGGILGFLPYNRNPAKIFMGDTGALLLGYILATMSIQGLFKFYAIVGFAVPFLVLAIPIADIVNAVARRLLKGKNPMSADREHMHHKLIDMGFNQKQAVAILYSLSGILGILAVVVTTSGEGKALMLLAAIVLAGVIVTRVLTVLAAKNRAAHKTHEQKEEDKTTEISEESRSPTEKTEE